MNKILENFEKISARIWQSAEKIFEKNFANFKRI